jgi:hypothetical protein
MNYLLIGEASAKIVTKIGRILATKKMLSQLFFFIGEKIT